MRLNLLLCGLAIVGLSTLRLTAAELVRQQYIVDGIKREALVYIPSGNRNTPTPLVFAFHGHGGSMQQAARSFPIHQLWPEAMVVYPQGLPTVGKITDPKAERSGWQPNAGDNQDRDLKFFDALLVDLRKKYRVDDRRVYATGHSNGGSFTYLLWAERGDVFAAVAPSAAVLGRGTRKFQPLPVLHLGSPQDELVKFSWQKRMIVQVLKINGCGPQKDVALGLTTYPSSKGAEVATYLHSNGHKFPETATEQIVKFLQRQAKR